MSEVRTQHARRRAGLFAFFIAAQVLLVGAIWQYHQVLVTVYDAAVGDLFRNIGGRASSFDDFSVKSVRAIVYVSSLTAQNQESKDHQSQLAKHWVQFLESEGFSARTVEEWPTAERLSRHNLLILPAVSCMSDEEIAAVKSYVAAGNGVILTWASGVQNERGEWRERSLMGHMAGIKLNDDQPPVIDEFYSAVTLSAQSPLVNGLPPGFILRLRRFDPPVAAVMLEPRSTQAGAWVDEAVYNQDPEAILSFSEQQSAIVHGPYMEGRFVWMGFTIASSDTETRHAAAFREVIRNAVLWAARQPQAIKPAWPGNADTAFSLSMEVRQPSDLDPRVFALVRKHRIPLTLYVTKSMITDAGVDALLSQDDLEWAMLDEETGMSSFRQEVARFKQARRLWEQRTASTRLGYRSASGQISEGAMDALVRARFDYVAALDSDHAIPHIVRAYRPVRFLTRSREMWMLPQQVAAVQQQEEANGAAWQRINEVRFRGIQSIGGYYNLYLPSGWLDADHISELDELIASIKRRQVWIASAGQVADYWKQWGNIKMTATYPSPNRMGFNITNSGLETVHDVVFFLEFNEPRTEVKIKPLTLGSPQLITSTRDGLRWMVHLNSIPPGKNYAYHIDNL